MRLQLTRRKLIKNLQLSLQLLGAHRLRTTLSVSGLLVGVATVMVMVALAEGAQRRVLQRVRALGTDLLVVNAPPALQVAGRQRQTAIQTALRPADASAVLEQSRLALAAAPAVSRSTVAHVGGLNTNTTLVGTTTSGLRIRNVRAEKGRVFDDDENRELRRVAVLGSTVVRNLFGTSDPVGQSVRVAGVPFDVIGVARPRGTDPGGTDLDNVIVIPLETAMRRVLNIPYVHAVYIQGRNSDVLDALESEVRAILLARHDVRSGAVPFVIQNQAVLLRTERGATRALSQLTIGAATFALLIGGTGILTLMLLSVRERRREIGLRRALGARRSDILLQFVLESALLAAAGGAAGVVAGLLAAGAAALIGPWDLVLSSRAALLGLTCSAALGVSVGVIPAARAARLEPITALRAE
jgi:putative ABC transport system permease protein